jgi:hypothetical protein
MTNMQKSGHYLSQYYRSQNSTDLEFRRVNLVARAVYSASGLKSFSTMQVRVVSISTTGAILEGNLLRYLADQFYLCFGEREIFITCARRNMVAGKLAVTFSHREDPAFIQALARVTFPLSTLSKLRGTMAPAIEARITCRHTN